MLSLLNIDIGIFNSFVNIRVPTPGQNKDKGIRKVDLLIGNI